MWSGDGEREVVQTVTFSENFRSVPVVNVGISMWDVDVSTNLRADILAQNITVSGFDIVFKTWGDSKLARIRASWTAFGEVQEADDWTL
ncbi:UNVERIFIED_CONTAM: hypothetical protein GTU68_022209 [Idotea baltica]|nr:hypothetical protein [Idotea baltica]